MMNRAAEEMIRAATRLTNGGPAPGAHLNAAHVGHIQCALGTIHHGDTCAELRSDPWLGVLRAYLLVAAGLVLVRIGQLVGGH